MLQLCFWTGVDFELHIIKQKPSFNVILFGSAMIQSCTDTQPHVNIQTTSAQTMLNLFETYTGLLHHRATFATTKTSAAGRRR